MSKKLFVIQPAGKSHCTVCHATVDLLTPEDVSWPMFFVCWACRRVFQVGVGEVKRE